VGKRKAGRDEEKEKRYMNNDEVKRKSTKMKIEEREAEQQRVAEEEWGGTE
jgi:hypothetical protein